MANGRHSYVAFYPSDWRAGVGHLTRMHRSVFFDVCCHIWDRAESCPATRLPLILGDLKHWQRYVDELVADGKLTRLDDGSLTNDRAMGEAVKSRDLHAKKSAGGRKGADKTNAGSAAGTPDGNGDAEKSSTAAEPEPDISPIGDNTRERSNTLPRQPIGVDGGVWRDFKRQRKKPLTQTALDGIVREAGRAGWSLDQALRECCARGWQGFKAEWVNGGGNRNGAGRGNQSGVGLVDAIREARANRTAGDGATHDDG